MNFAYKTIKGLCVGLSFLAATLTLPAQTVTTLLSNQSMVGDGVAVDSSGNIFVASGNGNGFVWKLATDGSVSEFANGLDRAVGVAVDGDDNVLVGNYGSGEISKFTPNGEKTTFASGLDGPAGIAIDSAGNIHVSQFGANFSGTGALITRFTPSGESSEFAAGGFLKDVIGISIDDEDNVYFTNWTGGTIYRIPSGSTTPELFVELPDVSNINQISYSNGYLYVPAPMNELIYRVDLDGNYELFAGTGVRGSVDGPALKATFSRPNSVTSNPAGDVLYVIDNGAKLVRQIDLPEVTRVSTLVSNQDNIGDGLAVNAGGEIFIASGSGDSIVWKMTPEGDVSEFANGFAYAVGVAIDEDQNIFVNNYNSNVLTKISPDGVKSEFATGLNGPAGLAIDSVGNIYVSEFGAGFSGDGARITRFTPSGERSVFAEGGFLKDVIGIAIDELDNVYFSNFSGGKLYRIQNSTTEQEAFASIPGSPEINQISYSNGYVYVPAVSTNKIYSVDQSGVVQLVAGSGTRGTVDGDARVSRFSGPNSIAANATGDRLYVIDDSTNDIRVIEVLERMDSEIEGMLSQGVAGVDLDVLIGGFVIEGESIQTVLVRAVGPGLEMQNVEGYLGDPRIDLYSGIDEIGSNEDWGDEVGEAAMVEYFEQAGAFQFASGSGDAAMVVELEPGPYTAVVSDEAGETGVALIEVYLINE